MSPIWPALGQSDLEEVRRKTVDQILDNFLLRQKKGFKFEKIPKFLQKTPTWQKLFSLFTKISDSVETQNNCCQDFYTANCWSDFRYSFPLMRNKVPNL